MNATSHVSLHMVSARINSLFTKSIICLFSQTSFWHNKHQVLTILKLITVLWTLWLWPITVYDITTTKLSTYIRNYYLLEAVLLRQLQKKFYTRCYYPLQMIKLFLHKPSLEKKKTRYFVKYKLLQDASSGIAHWLKKLIIQVLRKN